MPLSRISLEKDPVPKFAGRASVEHPHATQVTGKQRFVWTELAFAGQETVTVGPSLIAHGWGALWGERCGDGEPSGFSVHNNKLR